MEIGRESNDAHDPPEDVDFSKIDLGAFDELNNDSSLNEPEVSDDTDAADTSSGSKVESIKDRLAFIKDFGKRRNAEQKVNKAIETAFKDFQAGGEKHEKAYPFSPDNSDDDFHYLHYSFSATLEENTPHFAVARSNEELKMMLENVADERNNFHMDFDEGYMDYVLEHEGDHADAFRSMDHSADPFYILAFEGIAKDDEPPIIDLTPMTLVENTSLSKIELATACIFPTKPSDGDQEHIRIMGYKDEQDIIDRIIANNNRSGIGGRDLPLPKWYNPKG